MSKWIRKGLQLISLSTKQQPSHYSSIDKCEREKIYPNTPSFIYEIKVTKNWRDMFGLNTYCVNLIVYYFFLGKSITNKKLLKDTDVAPILIIITAYNGL